LFTKKEGSESELDDDLKAVDRYYLGDPGAVKKAMAAVANQGKAQQ